MLHDASSARVVPIEYPSPTPHAVVDLGLHAVLSTLAEYVPGAHGTQCESSAAAEPSAYPRPVSHTLTVFGMHGVWSLFALNVPAKQLEQDESSVKADTPSTYSVPAPHV